MSQSHPINISLCGDVMTGRGVDQILPNPGNPALCEPYVDDARHYVEMAEKANGPIAKPVDYSYVWGAALEQWNGDSPDVRLINLETAITRSDDYWHGKEVHYRMNPENIGCLQAARIDCCALANNHVLDWGYSGLTETLQTLKVAHVHFAGAGTNHQEAAAPVMLDVPGKGRVIVFSFGFETSGIPRSWQATANKAGVNLLNDMSESELCRIRRAVEQVKRDSDIVVASVHWGSNWGYRISDARRKFAHQLVDFARVDVIHGHSSHHVQGIEVHHDRLILYGCGDFLDDYEGIFGYEEYRGDLGILYSASVEPRTGELVELKMTPTQVRQMRIQHPCSADVQWLADLLNRESQRFGVTVEPNEHGGLTIRR